MRSEWNTSELEKLACFIDYRGKTPPKQTHGIPLVTAKIIKDNRIQEPKEFIAEDFYDEWMRRGIPNNGDVIFTTEAPLGEVARIKTDEKLAFAQRIIILQANPALLENTFLFYLLQTARIKSRIEARSTGTTVFGIKSAELRKVEIDYPFLPEQRAIATTLSCLDDKIDLNNKINANLEAQAQAIFKSWFVDFEPWGGVMPNDWREGTFSDIITTTLGGDWGKDVPTGNNTQEVYCIRGADIPDVNVGNKGKMPIRYIPPKNYASKQLTVGDIVVEISGGSPTQSTGRCALITQSLLDRYDCGMVCTNFCRAIKPLADYSPFIYFYIKFLYGQNVMFAYENGTTGIKNLNISGFLETEFIVIPPVEVVCQFASVVSIFIDKIFANGLESEKLANIRDILLPKLMSGEIEVPLEG